MGTKWGQPLGLHFFCIACRFCKTFSRRKLNHGMARKKRGIQFHMGIRIGNRKVKQSLQSDDAKEAQEIADRVDRRMKLIKQGDLVVTDGADILYFQPSKGKLTQRVQLSPTVSLEELCYRYLDEMSKGSIEANSVYTRKIHANHLRTVLGGKFNMERLLFADLQRYVDTRSKDTGRRGMKVSSVTIRKDLTSLSSIWAWGIRIGLIKCVCSPTKACDLRKRKRRHHSRPGLRSNAKSNSVVLQIKVYCHERPHQSLDYRTPWEVHNSSS